MIGSVRRAVIVCVSAVLVVPVALAAAGDPQKKFTKAGQAKARSVSLKLTDFGAGWKQGPPAKKDESNPRCSTYNPDQSDLIEIGSYDSPDFSRPDGTTVSSSSGVFKTVAMAKKAYSRVVVPQLPNCFAELFKKGITAPNSATVYSSGPLAFPSYGSRSNAYRIKVAVKTPSGTVPATIDLVVFNKSAIDVAIIIVAIFKPLPSAFEQSLVAHVAARV
jgi:hypothetical protein